MNMLAIEPAFVMALKSAEVGWAPPSSLICGVTTAELVTRVYLLTGRSLPA